MKHSHDIRHTKDNGSAQDCRHKENYIERQTRVTRETQLEPLKQWLSNKMGGDRQSTWEHMAPTNNKPCALHTETSGGQPGHTSRTVTTWLQKILKSETHKLQYLHLYILACALFFLLIFFLVALRRVVDVLVHLCPFLKLFLTLSLSVFWCGP